ncbi:histidine kinase [Microbacterium sp.]|uniref:histidine kinase n=1 Tax=Microbacterium sp. TaxID=51671 RepID=UPI003C70E046
MRMSTVERLAAGILALQSIALLVLAGWEVMALVSGDSADVGSSVALVVLTAVGAAGLAACAVAVARGASWGRSGGIVAQLLLLAVSFGALTGPAPAPATAVVLAVPAVLGLVLLILATRAAASRR